MTIFIEKKRKIIFDVAPIEKKQLASTVLQFVKSSKPSPSRFEKTSGRPKANILPTLAATGVITEVRRVLSSSAVISRLPFAMRNASCFDTIADRIESPDTVETSDTAIHRTATFRNINFIT